MWSNGRRFCIVYNGEVYNYKELQHELISKGYHFISDTDTEVVVNSIHCWGIDKALSGFIGMFAFAIWDDDENILYLCRDRAGIKPLYYHLTDDLLLFGSEMKALLTHSSFKRELNTIGLAQYFVTGSFLNSHTVYKNTFKLHPGHYLRVTQKGDLTIHKYWGLDTIKRNAFNRSFEDV